MPDSRKVLVSDFDGTMTSHDFYKLAVERFLTPADIAPWDDYRAGRITHFQAMQRIYGRVRQPRPKVLELLRDMRPDPRLAESVAALKRAGWDIVVASAGCEWYVRRILGDLGVDVAVHANPGEYRDGGPLDMWAATDSPFYNTEMGVDKAGIARHYLGQGKTVAYAGDGYTDEEGALLVPEHLRFAKGDLAEALRARKATFRPFSVWSEVAAALVTEKK